MRSTMWHALGEWIVFMKMFLSDFQFISSKHLKQPQYLWLSISWYPLFQWSSSKFQLMQCMKNKMKEIRIGLLPRKHSFKAISLTHIPQWVISNLRCCVPFQTIHHGTVSTFGHLPPIFCQGPEIVGHIALLHHKVELSWWQRVETIWISSYQEIISILN